MTTSGATVRVNRRDAGQRHLRAIGARHAQQAQIIRIRLPGRIGLQHHAVLVGLAEDGGDLPLAERVVQRVLDRLYRHAEPHRGVAIDVDVGAEAIVLLIGGDIHQGRIGG